jgi:hypothetical protein
MVTRKKVEGFPNLSKAKVGRLRIPVLISTGEDTIKIHRSETLNKSRLTICASQARQRSGALIYSRFTIYRLPFYPGSPRENPQAFNEAVLKFLANPKPALSAPLR